MVKRRVRLKIGRKVRRKFVLYSRTFFDRFTHTQDLAGPVNDRDEGWKEILRENRIDFVGEITIRLDALHEGTKAFCWTEIAQFLQDGRTKVIEADFFRPGRSGH